MKYLTHKYNEIDVTFTPNGWINATELSKQFSKLLRHYFDSPDTIEYVQALVELNTRNSGDLQPIENVEDSKYPESGYLETPISPQESPFVNSRRGKHGGTWIHPDLAVHFARWLSPRFAVWCDRQIKAILTGDVQPPELDWRRARHMAAASFKVMSRALESAREEVGKDTEEYHYMNEARLINWVLTDEFKGFNREELDSKSLDLLAKLEIENVMLLLKGIEFQERKKQLRKFLQNKLSNYVSDVSMRKLS